MKGKGWGVQDGAGGASEGSADGTAVGDPASCSGPKVVCWKTPMLGSGQAPALRSAESSAVLPRRSMALARKLRRVLRALTVAG